MKPLVHFFDEIVSLPNLFRAADATLSHGRRFRGEGARFKFNLEREVLSLHGDLTSGWYRPGRYRLFTVLGPKVRIIAAATVRDRVLHHAAHDVIEPRLDAMFIHDSFACRREKGAYRALDRAHGFLRANRYGLHLDVRSYFQSIDHGILKGLLRRYVADARTLALLEGIVDSTDYLARAGGAGASVSSVAGPAVGEQLEFDFMTGGGAGPDATERVPPPEILDRENHPARGIAAGASGGARIRGVPLGNLTSQFFANLYLNELDQFVKHKLKVRYYVRYMDDMLVFAPEKGPLLEWERAIREFARVQLRLELHPCGGPRPVRRGMGFLGFRLFPGCRKLKKASVMRFIQRMNGYTRDYFSLWPDRAGQAELLREIRQSTQSFHAHALNGDTYRIRKTLYARFPIVNQYGLAGMKGRWLERGRLARYGRRGLGQRPVLFPAALLFPFPSLEGFPPSWIRLLAEGVGGFKERGDGHASDRGEDARAQHVAVAQGGEVPTRSAPAVGRAPGG